VNANRRCRDAEGRRDVVRIQILIEVEMRDRTLPFRQ
jgi:hypothetical protein